MEGKQAVRYALRQSRRVVEVVSENDELVEAVANACGWADVAYEGMVENGIPALYAASSVVNAINAHLTKRMMLPSGDD